MNKKILNSYHSDLEKIKQSYIQKFKNNFQSNTENSNIRLMQININEDVEIIFSTNNLIDDKCYSTKKANLITDFDFDQYDIEIIEQMVLELNENIISYMSLFGKGIHSFSSIKKNQLKLQF